MSLPETFTDNLRKALARNRNTLAARNNRISQLNAETRNLRERADKLQRTLDSIAGGSASIYRESDILRLSVHVMIPQARSNPHIIDIAMQSLARDLHAKLRQ